ncbi:23S rRNA (uracil(1939)-C(5))-methyltransferase RlmD [Candidatus Albibeggiatoa sp. nov. NOAA]|uniref:23S rRNA (uracil(1939)-C(5))-methyltransferase RlmD n=1 Tax=Candidatus Albibeggiatoa sp. nov. NOAA TaxID=3162724 RepID=UPI0032FF9014|nr:23S rRNA (uracil(1939)-C(5))-methyltransferase RlmD [Thiotrichaceae bacterium]
MARYRRKKLPKDPVETQVQRLSHDGRGIAQIEGKTIFISGALPNETVLFRYTNKQKNFDEGVTLEVLQPASNRVEPPCEHFGVCGGCSLQHLSCADQIQLKQDMLLEQFEHLGNVTPETVMPPLQANSLGYRRKARLGVRYVPKKQSVLVGFREQQSSFIADLNQCKVLHPSVGEKITALREILTQLTVRDKIAQIEVAVGDEQTALVFRNLVPLSAEDENVLCHFGETHNLLIYLQPKGIDSVYPLYPHDLPLESLSYTLPNEGVSFQFAAHDFTQVNTEINRMMVQQAMDWLQPQAEDEVLDLFCGLGNFTLPLAKRAKQVIGVEGSESLVQRAKANAQAQGIFNTEYYVANLAEEPLEHIWMQRDYDKVLLDPPRSGAMEIIKALDFKQTQRIVYVSCNPSTLARDAGILVNEKGFKLVQAGVMDMFPHTAHVESMALFER